MAMDIDFLYDKFLQSRKISTDTRQITPGSVFFALKGPKFNANAFAEEALAKGALCAVIDDPAYARDDRFILVDDSLLALQELARHHRKSLTIPIIGLTGSNGKTTSKELVSAVLARKFKTFSTKGNLNNHIGVPLTILSIDESYQMAVVEMGANHVGEIALLCSIASPTHGFITNIGKAHIGTFGGFENIIRGKSELYQHLIQANGTVFINSQNPILANMAKRFKSPVFYPGADDYYHCSVEGTGPMLCVRAENGEVIQTQLAGAYNFENAAVALCIGKFFGVDPTEANQAVASYTPGNMRSQVLTKGTNTIILDAYNANPSSMEAAIENLAAMQATRKVAIVGNMYELEEEAEEEHKKIGVLLGKKNIQQAFLVGELMQAAKATYPTGSYFATKDDLVAHLKKNPIEHSVVLIKASRGMALETILEVL